MTKSLRQLSCLIVFPGALLLTQSAHAQNAVPDTQEWAMLSLLNNFRATYGVAPLQISQSLQNAAQWMATDQANNNYYGYRDSLRRTPDSRLPAFGYINQWGEDNSEGYSDAQSVFNQWVSACTPDAGGICQYGHQRFILSSSYVVIGIGRAYKAGSSYGWYWTIDLGTVKDLTISPGAAPPPSIAYFSAVPSTITPGASTTLSWSVLGATTVTLDNGVGDVSSTTFKAVSPAATTTYTLTAANSGGTVTAKTTVTLNLADLQPPSVPAMLSAVAKSASAVDLTWSASTDNVGVAGYQLIRNGYSLTFLPGNVLSYTDTSASPSTTYSYAIKAFDAAGNYSAASVGLSATTPAPPAISNCPAPAANAFAGCYFGNLTLSGSPVLLKTDNQLMFDWTAAFPGRSQYAGNFSVRWQGNFTFAQGSYAFTSIASDGMRVYIDGQNVLDAWKDQPPTMYTFNHTMTAGTHLVVVEFYNHSGWPMSYLWWQKQ